AHCLVRDFLKSSFYNYLRHATVDMRETQDERVLPDHVSYFLYTSEHSENDTRFDKSDLDPLVLTKKGKIVFIIHGWNSNREVDWVNDLKNALLTTNKNYSVVEVDWREPADELYHVAALNTIDVAGYIGDIILDLTEIYGVNLNDLLIIGHSLGGQIAGFIGKYIKIETGKRLSRIIALDPAGPLFEDRPEYIRLNRFDAKVVQVVHTDINALGFEYSCGTIDFYANGGHSQPGCKRINLRDIRNVIDQVTCNHYRASQYFVEAINNPKAMLAKRCTIRSEMCEEDVQVNLGNLTTTEKGNFFFETNDVPYSKNDVSERKSLVRRVLSQLRPILNVIQGITSIFL
ncbi:hypothetical protein JTB14_014396, partial [Gonioctena quinquepunctata]